MPNATNVTAPINIHGFGRSGTTLLQNLLGATGFIQVCNEPMGLLFHSFRGGETMVASHDKEITGLPHDHRAPVRAVHAAYAALLPSSKPGWCQKLGGIPNTIVWDTLISEEDRAYAAEPYAFPYAWWWRCVQTSFPLSQDLLTLRAWRNVLVSRVKLIGGDAVRVTEDLAVYYNLMAHPAAHFDMTMRLEDLAKDPAKTTIQLCRTLGITYKPDYLRAMEWYASGSRERDLASARDKNFSWQEDYKALGRTFDTKAKAIMGPSLKRIRARFETDLNS